MRIVVRPPPRRNGRSSNRSSPPRVDFPPPSIVVTSPRRRHGRETKNAALASNDDDDDDDANDGMSAPIVTGERPSTRIIASFNIVTRIIKMTRTTSDGRGRESRPTNPRLICFRPLCLTILYYIIIFDRPERPAGGEAFASFSPLSLSPERGWLGASSLPCVPPLPRGCVRIFRSR